MKALREKLFTITDITETELKYLRHIVSVANMQLASFPEYADLINELITICDNGLEHHESF